MKRLITPFLFAAAFLTVACTREIEETISLDPIITIDATTIEPDFTRTTLQDNGVKVYWEPEDEIAVFYNGSCGRFVSQNEEPALTAKFEGTLNSILGFNEGGAAENPIWGLYPYREDASSDKLAVTTVLPAEQLGRAGSFARNTQITLARANSLSLGFYNVTGGLRFSLTQEGIKKVTFEGANSETLAGTIKLAFAEGCPVIQEITDGKSLITLTAPDGESFQTGQWYYFAAIPGSLTNGFKMTFYKDGEFSELTSDKSVSFKRGIFGSISDVDANLDWQISRETQLAIEREALIDFYNALDGDNWIHKENWCSDKPLNEWYGVNSGSGNGVALNYETDFVESIYLYGNNLKGQIPESFYSLIHLKEISLPYNNIDGSFSTKMANFKDLMALDFRNDNIHGDDLSWLGLLTDLRVVNLQYNPIKCIPKEIGNLEKLEVLTISPLSGIIPKEIGQLTRLRYLHLLGSGVNQEKLDGTIPDEIGMLTNLISLEINSLSIGGTIPKTFGNLINLQSLNLAGNELEGPLPIELSNLHNLHSLSVCYNKLCGTIPSEYGQLPLIEVDLSNNRLSGALPTEMSSLMDNMEENTGARFRIWSNNWFGPIPDSWQKHPMWKYLWHHIMASGGFDTQNVYIPGPDIKGNDSNGDVIDSASLYRNNNYTLLFEYNPYIDDLLPLSFVDNIYSEYHDLGISIVIFGDLSVEDAAAIKQSHPDYHILSSTEGNTINGFSNRLRYPATVWDWQKSAYNKLTIVNSNGLVSYSTVFDNLKLEYSVCTFSNKTNEQLEKEITLFFQTARGDNPNSLYLSSDYSHDGVVTQIQSSEKGAGVSVVLMGDGFSDRQIADGTYGLLMQKAINALFIEEPFKSMRDFFNIYTIDVVSPNEGYENGSVTALSTSLSSGTTVIGNNARVISYGLKAIQEDKAEDCLFIVLMNKDAYAGTCYMYNPPSGNYGRGLSIAYFPVSSDTDTFNGLVSHEAGGHGFAKLADEYAYESMGVISANAIASTRVNEPYGWWKNVDFTSNPTQVKWAQFLSDERYANEGLGCYEGGLTYWTGVWRPTENSIMRHNTGGFNAPSRYAIWYRINKLAYGENWNGTYEDFVAFDAPNRTPAAAARRAAKRANYDEKQFQPLAPPVVVGHGWREELVKKH